MQSIPVLLDITKFADFQWKNTDVSITQAVYHVIYVGFFTFYHVIYVGFFDFC